MKDIFRASAPQDVLVPTLFCAYFDELVATNDNTVGSCSSTSGEPLVSDSSNTTTALEATVTTAVSRAVVAAFQADPTLDKVYVKPTHMCRGLGITVISRRDCQLQKEEKEKDEEVVPSSESESVTTTGDVGSGSASSGSATNASHGGDVLKLNRDLFRAKLSKELAPLALSTARRGVIVEPLVRACSSFLGWERAILQ
jgi:hypothetical protein